MPVDAAMAISGAEWQVQGLPGVGGAGAPPAAGGAGQPGFGTMLADAVGSLSESQAQAAHASQALAAGTVSDPTEVVMAVERARLAMQLASQLRTRGVEAFQDVFHTQV